jgi:hypothetical protein
MFIEKGIFHGSKKMAIQRKSVTCFGANITRQGGIRVSIDDRESNWYERQEIRVVRTLYTLAL